MNRKEIIEELNQIGFYIYQIKNDKENTDSFLTVLEIRVQSLLNKLNDEA
jgi:hypothetical protein